MNATARVIFVLAAFSLSCVGAPRGAPLQCDAESAELAMGYHLIVGPDRVLGSPVLYENGYSFLFIGADCRFWTFDATLAAAVGWAEVRTGSLSEAELAELNDDLFTAAWPAGERRLESMIADDSMYAVWRSGHPYNACSGSCPSGSDELRALRAIAEIWIDRLYARGVAAQGAMRIDAYEDADVSFDRPVEWEGDLDLASLPGMFGRYGDYPDVTAPEETARLRALRTDFLEGRIGNLGIGHVPLSQDGIHYRVWFRDTLPFENPSGVVRPTM